MTVVSVDFRDVDWHREQAKGCDGKVPLGRDVARSIAGRARRKGEPMSAYRCPWATAADPHWHVGHTPSLHRLEEIAAAIRNRANDPDTGEPAA